MAGHHISINLPLSRAALGERDEEGGRGKEKVKEKDREYDFQLFPSISWGEIRTNFPFLKSFYFTETNTELVAVNAKNTKSDYFISWYEFILNLSDFYSKRKKGIFLSI